MLLSIDQLNQIIKIKIELFISLMNDQPKEHQENNVQITSNHLSEHRDSLNIVMEGEQAALQMIQEENRQNIIDKDDNQERKGDFGYEKEAEMEEEVHEAKNNVLEAQEMPELPVLSYSKVSNNKPSSSNPKEDKGKKKKVRQFVQDFSPFLPESLIILNKTIIPALIRVGQRYQVQLPKSPPYQKITRPMQQWLIWDGNNNPHKLPNEDHLQKFKQLLGENRTEEQLIHMRERLKTNSWRQVLEYVNRNRSQLRRIFHLSQRNRF